MCDSWTAGNGIVVYKLLEPFEQYVYDKKTPQWKELWRSDERFYPEVVYQVEENVVRLVNDIFSDTKGVYDLNVETLEFKKLL